MGMFYHRLHRAGRFRTGDVFNLLEKPSSCCVLPEEPTNDCENNEKRWCKRKG
jgi:hypothetical protein